jgi:hypothetical protein
MRHVPEAEQRTQWKEGPSVKINTHDVKAAWGRASFHGVRSPWTSLSAMGLNHALTANPAPAAGAKDARLAAFRQIPAMTMKQQLAAKATGLPTAIDNRKHNVYMTRVNAGGDGASGPHPERAPA